MIDDTVVTASEVVVDVSVEKPLEYENIATIVKDDGIDKSVHIKNVVVVEGDNVNPEPAREASIMLSPQSIFSTNLDSTKNDNNMLMHNSRLGMTKS
jgi:hypothetical protein